MSNKSKELGVLIGLAIFALIVIHIALNLTMPAKTQYYRIYDIDTTNNPKEGYIAASCAKFEINDTVHLKDNGRLGKGIGQYRTFLVKESVNMYVLKDGSKSYH